MLNREIMRVTFGEKSLDNVMRFLYERYGLNGVWFNTQDILMAVSTVTNKDFTNFFANYVYGTKKLPLEQEFGTACCPNPPFIFTQPQGQRMQIGQSVTLSVVASGSSITFQWYQGNKGDTSNPVGSISSTFTTPALTQMTSYWVRISSPCGAVESEAATITVTIPPGVGVLSVSPLVGGIFTGAQGGPFHPSDKTYTLQNTGEGSLNWSASGGSSWVFLSSTGGTLAAGGSATVTISIDPAAITLSPGSYSDTLTFTNITNSYGNTYGSIKLYISKNTVLYDDFLDSHLNTLKWKWGEFVREIDTSQKRLRLKYATPNADPVNDIAFPDPGSVNSFEADITVEESSVTGSANTVARLGGRWYNDGTSGTVEDGTLLTRLKYFIVSKVKQDGVYFLTVC